MTPSMISVVLPQRDGDAEVRNAVEVIHGAVDGIDDPMESA